MKPVDYDGADVEREQRQAPSPASSSVACMGGNLSVTRASGSLAWWLMRGRIISLPPRRESALAITRRLD